MARPKHPERCGRWGDSTRHNTEAIADATAGASLITEEAKRLAAARRAKSPVSVEQMPGILQAWADYIEECEQKKQPLTWGGFALAAGISARTLARMRNEELDHIVEEYRITHDLPEDAAEAVTDDGEIITLVPWSRITQKLENLLQDQLERNCYTNKGNPAGSIFGLKACFGWEDQQAGTTTNNNTLVIADADQARKAMELLTNG